jgi:threonylcarbamoyladenosine tRNA methylthiotransferase MtaB
MARQEIPDLAITTDVMVGFPGESDEEFNQSLRFCERMDFARVHVFPYSARPGTTAANMPNKIGDKTKRERGQAMLELARRSARSFHRVFLSKTLTVLWEGKRNGIWSGLTDNYLRVFVQSEEPLSNRLLPATLVAEHELGLWGNLGDELSRV